MSSPTFFKNLARRSSGPLPSPPSNAQTGSEHLSDSSIETLDEDFCPVSFRVSNLADDNSSWMKIMADLAIEKKNSKQSYAAWITKFTLLENGKRKLNNINNEKASRPWITVGGDVINYINQVVKNIQQFEDDLFVIQDRIMRSLAIQTLHRESYME